MDTQTVLLELPTSLYRAAHQVTEATGQSVEDVLQASIAHALPPLDNVPPADKVWSRRRRYVTLRMCR